MWKWHDAGSCRAAEQHAKAAAALLTAGISKRRGGGVRWREKGGGGARREGAASCSRDLKFGSGHHCLDVCGPSNGRQKLA